MKRIKVILIAAVILCISLGSFSAAESSIIDSLDFQGEEKSVSLEKATETILGDNPTIKKAELDLEQAKVDYDKGRSALRKVKKVYKREGSLDYLENVKLLELSNEFTLANAHRNYDATVENIKADLELSYFSLLQAEKLVEINKQNLEVAKDLYETIQKKLELGLVAKQEVLNSELNYINAENEYKAALDNAKKAKMMLNIKLGYEIMMKTDLVGELKYKEYQLGSVAEAISKAWESRNEIKAAEFKYELEKINMEITSIKYPEITYLYREQKVELEKALKNVENARKNIELEVRSNYLDILQKQDEIKASEKSVELAEEALRLYQSSYDVGMSVITDVQKAQSLFMKAKLGLSKAILDYNLAVLKYEDSIGVGRTAMGLS